MSKKFILGLLLTAVLLPGLALAVPTIPESCLIKKDVSSYLDNCGTGTCSYADSSKPCALCCLMGTTLYVVDIVYVVLIVIVIFFVFMGSFKILTAGGNPGNVNEGRNYILYAAAGLVVAILAKAIPNLIKFFIGA